MTGLRAIPEAEARSLIVRQLVGVSDSDQVAIQCALLRSCVWALSGGTEPVHILRLLNLAVSHAPYCSIGEPGGAGVRSKLKQSLDELADVGDLVALANGRWLPAPTREVRLETSDDARLLVGGFPTSLLPPDLAGEIQHAGPFRRTRGELLAQELRLPAEDCSSWIGEFPPDLSSWTKAAFEGLYEAFSEPEDSRQFWVYAPELARPGSPQAFRWCERSAKMSGRYLGRRDLPFGIRQYRALEIVRGQLVRVMLPNLRTGDLRRLMYGLDAKAGNPVVVEMNSHGGWFKAILSSELPEPERRYFGALGELIVVSEKYYPRTWRFSIEHADEVGRRLSALGVRLTSKNIARATR